MGVSWPMEQIEVILVSVSISAAVPAAIAHKVQKLRLDPWHRTFRADRHGCLEFGGSQSIPGRRS